MGRRLWASSRWRWWRHALTGQPSRSYQHRDAAIPPCGERVEENADQLLPFVSERVLLEKSSIGTLG
jgi:hypothetical protein